MMRAPLSSLKLCKLSEIHSQHTAHLPPQSLNHISLDCTEHNPTNETRRKRPLLKMASSVKDMGPGRIQYAVGLSNFLFKYDS